MSKEIKKTAGNHPHSGSGDGRVFAIASSTGGPLALSVLLGGLSRDFPCPILISQHIADGFAEGMVAWLGRVIKMSVSLAKTGDSLKPGRIYVSPANAHLAVSPSRQVVLIEHSLRGGRYHPNCDTLLNSMALVYQRAAVGIILTGMGDDGVAGISAIYKSGGVTLAQDESSSVVYGMNKLAIDQGVVHKVLGLKEIALEMQRLALLPVSPWT